ncbi:MAG: CAP domain-containing protein [Nocardioides sp.]
MNESSARLQRIVLAGVLTLFLTCLTLAGSLAAPSKAKAEPPARTAGPASMSVATKGVATKRAEPFAYRPYALRQLRRINTERAAAGLRPLRLGRCLTRRAAQPWAKHMARTGDFNHQDLGPVMNTCDRFSTVGENIAYGYRNNREVMSGWMNSPGHRANLLSPNYTHVGLGLKRNADGTKYWVQNFGG